MYTKLMEYLKSESKIEQRYKEIIAMFVILISIYSLNIIGNNLIASLEGYDTLYKVFDFIVYTTTQIGYNVILLTTLLNIILYNIEIFKFSKISIHIVTGNILNLITMVTVIYILALTIK